MNNDNSLKSLRDRTLVSLMALEGLRTVELGRAEYNPETNTATTPSKQITVYCLLK